MSHAYADVRFSNPFDPSRGFELRLLVDTGSTYTWIRGDRLREIGVEPRSTRRFRTVDGRLLERVVAEAVVECMGERATTVVVFAEDGDAEVLGVHALEGLGLEVDPDLHRLRRTKTILAL